MDQQSNSPLALGAANGAGDADWSLLPAATPIASGADPTPSAFAGQAPDQLAFSEGDSAEPALSFGRPGITSPTATLKAVNDDPDANLIEPPTSGSTESAAAPSDPDSSAVGAIAGVGGLAVLGAAGAALMIRRRQAAVETEQSFEEQKPQ